MGFDEVQQCVTVEYSNCNHDEGGKERKRLHL